MTALTQSLTGAKTGTSTLSALFVAFSLGAALVFLTGFAQPELIHNAAHDWRHSMNFPCH